MIVGSSSRLRIKIRMAFCELIFLKRGARGRQRLQWLGRCCFLMAACHCMACVVALPLAAAAPAPAVAVAAPDSELDREPTWSPPTPAAVRQRMFDWIAASGSATEAATAARGLWPEAAAAREDAGQTGVDDLLDRVMTTFALLDPRCAALQADLAANRGWLGDAGTTDFQRESVKLWLGREFVRQDRFDDGLAVLGRGRLGDGGLEILRGQLPDRQGRHRTLIGEPRIGLDVLAQQGSPERHGQQQSAGYGSQQSSEEATLEHGYQAADQDEAADDRNGYGRDPPPPEHRNVSRNGTAC
jgi:hypothetical protein